MVEDLYKADALKDFKMDFAKESLAYFDEIEAVLPEDLKSPMITSRKLVEHEGPMYEYNFQSTRSKENASKTNNLHGIFGNVTFEDSSKYLKAVKEISIQFNLGTDTELVFNEDTKNILRKSIPDFTPEEIEAKINESLAANGKSLYPIEEKNKKLTIGGGIMKSGNYAQINYKVSKDYPQ